jgi:hypothetical protein
LDIPSKIKDRLSAHKALQSLEIKEEVHPEGRSKGRAYLTLASYTLITEEKMTTCKCLHKIRVSIGFSTNIKNMVSM